ncbi:probable 3',5'-cyclic phosphodiesterase pde-5 [Xenia sp. Carnegie-2017]|uniref:probable 3',5'-cyclic phosphodiesterase pde-5 n=1 Tax=Xenia sp. Carnegie-2017 TaxID=2897299 RepID=UPI001F0425D4|nr:probable 3',5'-cyclic phosphodiesterase pde-5 [Xenia sp. Carnegie-2017]
MSSPAKQMSTSRKLPPLPGSRSTLSSKGSSSSTSSTSTLSTKAGTSATSSPTQTLYFNEKRMADRGVKELSKNLNDGPFKPALLSTSLDKANTKDGSAKHIDAKDIRTFLHYNPAFLDDFIMTNVDEERLERWLVKKTGKQEKRKACIPSADKAIPKVKEKAPLSKWKFCVKSQDKKKILFEELKKIADQSTTTENIVYELVQCLALASRADSYALYLMDNNKKEMYLYSDGGRTSRKVSIENGETIAAFVAKGKTSIRTDEVLADSRFPKGIGVEESTAQSVICQPIMASNESLVGVVELTRRVGHEPFSDEEEEIVNSYLVWELSCGWGGFILYYAEALNSMSKHKKLSEFLLTVTRSIFQDIVSMDTVIMKIMNYAQTLVDADRTSLFLVDSKTDELYARIFDVGGSPEESMAENLKKEIRFPKSKGVAGYVATSGETLNITEAYKDKRFNREIDLQTGYTTKTLLCMPIFIRGNIIGVVQMVNKKKGVFTAEDEHSFQTFATYCGLALHHAKLYDKIRRSEQKYKVALEVLSYHSMCTDEEMRELNRIQQTQLPAIDRFCFDAFSVEQMEMVEMVIQMFKELFSLKMFDVDELTKFTLTVRRNYRKVPYHNWTHAFSVAHCMFMILRKASSNFTLTESLALFVACLCHDLDHRGRTNSWMKKEGTALASVYTTSPLEHHHFNQTITILQHEGHNIFSKFSSSEYKSILGHIKYCILATDLAVFFGNKGKLKQLLDAKKFSWKEYEHTKLVQAIAMTGCDLSACTKPWTAQFATVTVIFQEFYAEGDEVKRQGSQPIPMMDRDTAEDLPAHQVGFLVGICLPCYEMLHDLFPHTGALLEGARANLKRWSELVAKKKPGEQEQSDE